MKKLNSEAKKGGGGVVRGVGGGCDFTMLAVISTVLLVTVPWPEISGLLLLR